MSCIQHQTALREHAIGGPLHLALEAHLAECEDCGETLATERRVLGQIDAALDGLRLIEPSPAFLARARAQLEDTLPSRAWLYGPRWYAVLAVAAAGLAVALGVMIAGSRQQSEGLLAIGHIAQAPAHPSPSPVGPAAVPPSCQAKYWEVSITAAEYPNAATISGEISAGAILSDDAVTDDDLTSPSAESDVDANVEGRAGDADVDAELDAATSDVEDSAVPDGS